jgi:hypothetical protein
MAQRSDHHAGAKACSGIMATTALGTADPQQEAVPWTIYRPHGKRSTPPLPPAGSWDAQDSATTGNGLETTIQPPPETSRTRPTRQAPPQPLVADAG